MTREFKEHVYGCLYGVAIGDAMGMPTTFYTPDEIKRRFGFVEKFLDAPRGHPIHDGYVAGQVTDDTELTVVIANTIIENKEVNPQSIAKGILNWAIERNAFESQMLGPSTSRALKSIMEGKDIVEAGRLGTTNGASMRISPVAIFNAWSPLENVVEDVEKACIPTHGTNIAISAASAVACAIVESLKGNTEIDAIIEAAKRGARLGSTKGFPYPAASVEKRIELTLEIIGKAKDGFKAALALYDYIGAGVESNEAIPTALGLFYIAKGNPMTAIKYAVNMGGDADTIASITGAICGAFKGIKAFPNRFIEKIEKVNKLNLQSIADKLIEITRGK